MDSPSPTTTAQEELRSYLRIIKKRWLLITAVTLVVLGGFAGWTLMRPRIYDATATVIIDPIAPKVLPGQDVVELGAGNSWDNQQYYNTQIRIIKSRWLAREVVQKKPELIHDPRLAPRGGVRVPGAPAPSDEELTERAIQYVMGGVRVEPVRESRIFGITFADRDPKLAAELSNAIAATYIEQNRAVKVDQTRDATRWVAKQLDDARKELDRSETALYSYKRDNNILSVNLEERQNMLSKSLDTFSSALTATKKQRIDLQTRLKAIQGLMIDDPANAPSTYVAQADSIISNLRGAYLEERRKLQFLTDKYGEKWPDVVAQKARTDQTLTDLRTEGNRLVSSISAEIHALEDAESRYTSEVKKLTDEALDLNQKEIAYKRLTRDAVNAEQVYALLLKRLNESGLQEQDTGNNIRPLDEALVPTAPSEPRLRLALALGLATGLVLALALAFLVEILDRSIKTQEDIEHALGLPFLGMVPSVDEPTAGVRELHILKHPKSSAAECCRVVRTNILFCSPDRPLKTLVVTSSNPLEGKTMTCVNLGVVMAQGGHRTLLLDSDMRRPRLHKVFGVGNEHGLSRLILGDEDIDQAVRTTEVPNLSLLACGPIPPNPAELLQTERFVGLLKRLGERYDRIILDSPPVLAVTDAAILSKHVDGTVAVVRAGRTTRDAISRTRSQLAAVSTNLLGVVLNDVDLKNPHYSGYYAYASKYYGTPTEAKAEEG